MALGKYYEDNIAFWSERNNGKDPRVIEVSYVNAKRNEHNKTLPKTIQARYSGNHYSSCLR